MFLRLGHVHAHVTPPHYPLNIDAAYLIKLDNKTENDYLITLESSDTLTLDDSESPTIKALDAAQVAADNAAFNLVIARIPFNYRIKV